MNFHPYINIDRILKRSELSLLPTLGIRWYWQPPKELRRCCWQCRYMAELEWIWPSSVSSSSSWHERCLSMRVTVTLVEHLPRSIALPVGVVLLNGAEPPAAMDVGASTLQACGPDFAQLGQQLLGHPQAGGSELNFDLAMIHGACHVHVHYIINSNAQNVVEMLACICMSSCAYLPALVLGWESWNIINQPWILYELPSFKFQISGEKFGILNALIMIQFHRAFRTMPYNQIGDVTRN